MSQRKFTMTNNPSSILAGILIFALSMSVGCGSKIELAQATGTITMDGKPLELIHIEFWSSNGPRSYAKTDSQGKFALKLDDGSQRMGAVPGEHKVCLRDTWPTKDDYLDEGGAWVDMSDGKRSRIDTKYYDAIKSPLTLKVEPGKDNVFDIKVDAAAR